MAHSSLPRVTVLVAAILGCGAALAQTPSSSFVSFVSIRSGDAHIYRTQPAGTDVKLTKDGTNNNQPAVSPDGRLIAYTSNRAGPTRIYLMNGDGSDVRALTKDVNRIESAPSFSPNGNAIAFYSQDIATGQIDLRVITLATGAVGVINANGRDMGPTRPSWSADGSKLTFPVHREEKQYEVWVANSDGSGSRIISDKFGKRGKGDPAMSPDGKRVVYVADMRGPMHIVVTDIETGTSVDLTPNVMAAHEAPKWSPDGKLIAFASTRDDPEAVRSDIFVMNADGTGVRNLSRNPAEDFNPMWSPDGSTVYFTSLRTGTAQLFAVDLATGRSQRITNNTSHDMEPAPGQVARN